MKKVLILTLFGEEIPWMDKYIDNASKVDCDWLIFTDKDYVGKGRVKVVKMSLWRFKVMFKKKLGKSPKGTSYQKMWDFRPAYGVIFEDYLKDYDFWGHTDHDCVYGDLDKFIDLDCDIWTNDPYPTICGHLTFWKNNDLVNKLFMAYPLWEDMLFGTNVHVHTRPLSGNLSPMSWTTSQLHDKGIIKINYDFDCQGNDKQPHELKYDNGLFCDGREIAVYHFRNSKVYPW